MKAARLYAILVSVAVSFPFGLRHPDLTSLLINALISSVRADLLVVS
jgi:hypothetical protein